MQNDSVTFMAMSVTDRGSITQEKNRVHPECAVAPDPRIAFFDHHAPTWDNDANEVAQTLQRLEALRKRLGLHDGQDVLEIGCGTGRITGWLAQAVHPGRVVAVDFSPAMLAQAQMRGVAAQFRVMDICDEAFTEEAFDIVFCFNAFPHFRDQLRALRNIRRLLKPSGELVVLHLIGSQQLNEFHAQLSHPVCHDHMPPPDVWREMLACTGLQLMSLTDQPNLYLLKAVPWVVPGQLRPRHEKPEVIT
jgi:SAM-dependent methyltransferase